MITRSGVILGILAFAAGCGGGSSGFSGSVKGTSFSPADTVSGSATLSGTSNTAGIVLIANVAGICADATASKRPKNSAAFFFLLQDVNQTNFSTTAPTAPGTYTISGSAAKSAIVSFASYDGTCAEVSAASSDGASGTVTLTSVNNGAYAGNFDVFFESGDHVTGSFSGTACSGLAVTVNQGNSFTCI